MGPKSKPPISPSDPLYTEKLLTWKILQDAVCKSCLTNDLTTNKFNGSVEAADYLAECRRWVMSMGTNMVGAELTHGSVAGFECGFCVEILGFTPEVFVKFMRGLWDERDDRIIDKLTHMRNKEKSRIASSNNKMRVNKPRHGPKASKSKLMIIDQARDEVYRSRKWGRDEGRV